MKGVTKYISNPIKALFFRIIQKVSLTRTTLATILATTFPSYSLMTLWLTYKLTHNLLGAILISLLIGLPAFFSLIFN